MPVFNGFAKFVAADRAYLGSAGSRCRSRGEFVVTVNDCGVIAATQGTPDFVIAGPSDSRARYTTSVSCKNHRLPAQTAF